MSWNMACGKIPPKLTNQSVTDSIYIYCKYWKITNNARLVMLLLMSRENVLHITCMMLFPCCQWPTPSFSFSLNLQATYQSLCIFVSADFVSADTFRGQNILAVDPQSLTLLCETAMGDIAHLLRPAHLQVDIECIISYLLIWVALNAGTT